MPDTGTCCDLLSIICCDISGSLDMLIDDTALFGTLLIWYMPFDSDIDGVLLADELVGARLGDCPG